MSIRSVGHEYQAAARRVERERSMSVRRCRRIAPLPVLLSERQPCGRGRGWFTSQCREARSSTLSAPNERRRPPVSCPANLCGAVVAERSARNMLRTAWLVRRRLAGGHPVGTVVKMERNTPHG